MGLFFFLIALALIVVAYLRTRGKRHKYAEANRWLFSWPAVLSVLAVTIGLIVLFSSSLSGSLSVMAAWVLRLLIPNAKKGMMHQSHTAALDRRACCCAPF